MLCDSCLFIRPLTRLRTVLSSAFRRSWFIVTEGAARSVGCQERWSKLYQSKQVRGSILRTHWRFNTLERRDIKNRKQTVGGLIKRTNYFLIDTRRPNRRFSSGNAVSFKFWRFWWLWKLMKKLLIACTEGFSLFFTCKVVSWKTDWRNWCAGTIFLCGLKDKSKVTSSASVGYRRMWFGVCSPEIFLSGNSCYATSLFVATADTLGCCVDNTTSFTMDNRARDFARLNFSSKYRVSKLETLNHPMITWKHI